MGSVEKLRQIPDIFLTENENLAEKTSLKVGGKARFFIRPKTVYALTLALKEAKAQGIKCKILGNGTNILVSDKGFDGLVASTANINGLLLDKGEIAALCGTSLTRAVKFMLGTGRTGVEGLIGIPASVGGAVRQNAGAFGYCVSDYITEVTSYKDGDFFRRDKNACLFGYRTSVFKENGEFIVSARFRLPKGRKMTCVSEYSALRTERQPSGRSCGSVFLNPEGRSAGKLVEKAGLKGFSVGGARVSEKHANFIINDGKATATDVFSLIRIIKEKVYEKFGVLLKEEVEFIGEF